MTRSAEYVAESKLADTVIFQNIASYYSAYRLSCNKGLSSFSYITDARTHPKADERYKCYKLGILKDNLYT